MRVLNAVLCLMMVTFVAVQHNDPDVLLWAAIYAVPAAWAGVAAGRPALLLRPAAGVGLAICLAAALAGLAYWWPSDAGWWRREVWWASETAREGMGMMIVTLVLIVVALTRWLGRGKSGRREPLAG